MSSLNKRPAFYNDPQIADRFWLKVDIQGPDECWEWAAARNTERGDYGVFHPRKPYTTGAHRFALEMKLGRPLKNGMYACHDCDNPPCVNPNHLVEGTHQENVADSVSKMRHKHGSKGSKLSDDDVLAIRHRADSGEKNRDLASEYGVHETLISMITRGVRWPYLGGPLSKKYKKKEAA